MFNLFSAISGDANEHFSWYFLSSVTLVWYGDRGNVFGGGKIKCV